MSSKKELEKMKCAELKVLAKDLGMEKTTGVLKVDLIEFILKAEDKKSDCQDDKQKMNYVETASLGTLVAFRLSNGKVKSAKIIKKSTKSKKLKLQTEYGAEFVVSYDDVIWVRTGSRWPKGVYNELKGVS